MNCLADMDLKTRNDNIIAGLTYETKQKVKCFLQKANNSGFDILLYSGYRNFAEQWELRKRYITNLGGIAAAPGYSWHNYRLAVDWVEVRPGDLLDWKYNNLKQIKQYIEGCGLVSGASFGDDGHIQNSINKKLSDYQQPFIDSIDYYKNLEAQLTGASIPKTPEKIDENKRFYCLLDSNVKAGIISLAVAGVLYYFLKN